MKIIDKYSMFVIYQYDSLFEFIEHLKQYRDYFFGSYVDENDNICGEFYDTILQNDILPLENKSNNTLKIKIKIDDLRENNCDNKNNINDTYKNKLYNDKENLLSMIDVALLAKDKKWFNAFQTDTSKYYNSNVYARG
jgi:hypothetical protein